MPVVAKYDGWCAGCHGETRKGRKIEFRNGQVYHPVCVPRKEEKPLDDAPNSVIRAMVRGYDET